MLPEKLQAFLKEEGKLLNAYYVYREGESEPRARMFDWEQYEMGRHKRYAEFLEACGHDTRDLLSLSVQFGRRCQLTTSTRSHRVPRARYRLGEGSFSPIPRVGFHLPSLWWPYEVDPVSNRWATDTVMMNEPVSIQVIGLPTAANCGPAGGWSSCYIEPEGCDCGAGMLLGPRRIGMPLPRRLAGPGLGLVVISSSSL
jgi:hypothetical protein